MLINVYWIQLNQNIIIVEYVIMLINVYWIQLNQNIIIVEYVIMLVQRTQLRFVAATLKGKINGSILRINFFFFIKILKNVKKC